MIGVVARNPQYRRIWLSQVVSQTGDWLNRMAVLALISRLSDDGEAIKRIGLLFASELALRMLPPTLMGSLAGSLADRLPRRLLMLTSDWVRAVTVLAMLLIREPHQLPWLYVLVGTQMATAMFFEAARSASVPSTVPREELHEAYTLSAATWSVMLSVGALLGGILVEHAGTSTAFVVDAATYVVSSLFLFRLRLPPVPKQEQAFSWRDVVLYTELWRGLAHARTRHITAAVLAKSFWGGAGGFLVLLSIAGSEVFTDPDGPDSAGKAARAIGLLFAARGLGTGLGPIVARRLQGSSDAALCRQIAAGFWIGGLGYAAMAFAQTLPQALAVVVFAHSGGSTLWVASTTLWQKYVDDSFRGRVYALEIFGMTLAFAAGGLFTGLIYDQTQSFSKTVGATSALVLLSGLAWRAYAASLPAAPAVRPGAAPSPAPAATPGAAQGEEETP